MSHEPEMNDTQFTNLFSIMIGGLILLTIALIILATVVASGINQSDLNQQVRDSQAVERIEAVGEIAVGEEAAMASGSESASTASGSGETEVASGESVYQSTCAACHASGVAGAPVFGNAAAWSDRIAKGVDTLYQHAINGFQGESGNMPAKGGKTSLSDEAVQAAVDHMVEAAK